MELRKPPPLHRGDGIGLVSTSSPVTPAQLDRLTEYLKARGYRVKTAEGVLDRVGHFGGTVERRAAGVSTMFADPEVALVLPVNGGTGAGHLVDRLDYAAIRDRPILFSGFSNPSVLNNAILAGAGVPSVHGVSGFQFFGWDEVDGPTEADFWRMVCGSLTGVEIETDGWRAHRLDGGSISGRVIGGSLYDLMYIAGTRWMPATEGAIVLIEAMGGPFEEIDRMLTHLRLAGVLDSIAGLVVGEPADWARGDAPDESTDALVLRCVGGSFPVISGVAFGHQERKLQLPIGCQVEFDLRGKRPVLRYLEDLVALE